MAEDLELTMPPLEERPLVTFALFAYNQEQYIREAVEGALAQTYEPLEIILSDDCSTDRTFEIMEEMAAKYTGPHTIILNKNPLNLGINKHVYSIDKKSKGELIIHAAGDDISLAERTTILTNAYLKQGKSIALIMSNSEVINDEGVVLGLYQEPGVESKKMYNSPVDFSSIGSAGTYAINRQLIESFLPPDHDIYGEDKILLARASLTLGSLYLDKVTVKYRISQTGVWSSNFLPGLSSDEIIARQANRSEDYLRILKQIEKDILKIKYTVTQELVGEIATQKRIHKNRMEVTKGNLILSFNALKSELKFNKEKKEIIKLFIIRWLPIVRHIKNKYWPDNISEALHPAVGYPTSGNLK